MKPIISLTTVFALLSFCIFSLAKAEDVLTVKTIGMELARDIATQSVLTCREQGYQVSAVVVDRNGNMRAALRDDLAARFTLQMAEEKANSVVLSGIDSGEFRRTRQDIRPELNHIDGIIILEGGLPIIAGGNRLGAVGVSGAPGADKDALCAKKALEAVEDRLEFID